MNILVGKLHPCLPITNVVFVLLPLQLSIVSACTCHIHFAQPVVSFVIISQTCPFIYYHSLSHSHRYHLIIPSHRPSAEVRLRPVFRNESRAYSLPSSVGIIISSLWRLCPSYRTYIDCKATRATAADVGFYPSVDSCC